MRRTLPHLISLRHCAIQWRDKGRILVAPKLSWVICVAELVVRLIWCIMIDQALRQLGARIYISFWKSSRVAEARGLTSQVAIVLVVSIHQSVFKVLMHAYCKVRVAIAASRPLMQLPIRSPARWLSKALTHAWSDLAIPVEEPSLGLISWSYMPEARLLHSNVVVTPLICLIILRASLLASLRVIACCTGIWATCPVGEIAWVLVH